MQYPASSRDDFRIQLGRGIRIRRCARDQFVLWMVSDREKFKANIILFRADGSYTLFPDGETKVLPRIKTLLEKFLVFKVDYRDAIYPQRKIWPKVFRTLEMSQEGRLYFPPNPAPA